MISTHTGEHTVIWELASYYGRHEGAFSSLFNLSQDLALKYLTGLTLQGILHGGYSAPENELRP